MALPTADEAFGPRPLPTADEAFPPPLPPVNTNAVALGGADMDQHFSQGSVGQLLDWFGKGAQQGWGTKPLGLDPETDAFLKKYAPDYGVVGRAFHDEIIRPAAAGLDFAMRAPGAVARGIYEVAPVVGGPLLAGMEAFPAGHLTGFPANVPPPQAFARAADLGVIGKGEAGYRDTADYGPAARNAAVEALTPGEPAARPLRASASGTATAEFSPTLEASATLPPLDVHAIAREIAPDTFAEYDALTARRDTFQRHLAELSDSRANGEEAQALQGRVDNILGKVNGVEDRLTKAAAARLEAARTELDGFLRTDTPEMARVRQELQTNDFARRDLSPEVSAAYRQAAEQMPKAEAEPVAPQPAAEAAQAHEAAPAPEIAPKPEPGAPAAAEPAAAAPALPGIAEAPKPPAAPLEGGIAGDVSRQLVTAGRPAEEAQAAAALVQAHYEARAERFGGTKGTAEDLYRAEAPNVRAGRGVQPAAMELAQKGELGQSLLDAGEQDRISTRVPYAAGAEEAAHATSENIVGLESSRAAGRAFEKNADLIKSYPGLRLGRAKSSDAVVERFIDHVKGNLLALYDRVPPEIRERSKLWYDGANRIAHEWADEYGYRPRGVAGVLAALSPQKDWFQNVDLARRVLSTLRDQRETRLTSEMRRYAEGYIGALEDRGKPADTAAARRLRDLLEDFEGKPLKDIKGEMPQAVWVRWFDEAHNDRSYRVVSPEGDFGDAVNTAAGKPQRVAWGSFNEIAKAISALQDDSPINISRAMGGNHKVRNFYNNIISPNAPFGDVTIDTHAIASGLMRPLSGNTPEVAQGLGLEGAAHAGTGSRGLYGLYAEAYRRAAAERDVLPREMQSITWEAIRGLFSPEQKRSATLLKAVEGVWNDYQHGRISLEQARQAVVNTAGGIEAPEWFGPRAGGHAGARLAAEPGDLLGDGVRGGASEALDRGTGNGVAGAVPSETASRELDQTRRGKIRLATDDAKATITLFKDADASTFIHETAHHWLEELIRDAVDERAPPDLAADAATVRQWLGVEDGADIPTRAHEKFARGFERYMMEGHAPSAKLAEVFAKFRDWLTRIYETVAGLRSPINDDIRSVFDRMLASGKEGDAVVAPERPTGTFADMHEADAAHTLPPNASETAALVRAERDRVGEAAHPEIQDERVGARAPYEDDGGASRGGDAGSSEPARGTDAGTESGVPGSRPVSESRGNAPTKGAGSSEPPAGANATFGPADSGLVDKAGNIRLDNLKIPDDVAQAIRDAAEQTGGFVAARRGVISDGDVLSLADALGMDAAKLNQRKLGQAFNAEEVVAARKLLIRSATEVRDAMARAASGSDADVLAYAQAKARHLMIQEQVSGITAEAGRALRAFRALEGSRDVEALREFFQQQTGRTLDQMRKEAQLGLNLDTPQQVSRFVQDSEKPTWKDYLVEAWINALLSGPKTHIKNLIGNAAVAVNSIAETGLAAAIGAVRQRLIPGAAAERVQFREVEARLFGLVQGAHDGVIAAGKAIRDENYVPAGARQVEQYRHQAIPSVKVNVAGIEMELGGKQVRLPSRMLMAEDEFFKAVATRQELNAIAYRAAMDEGLTGDAFTARVADLVEHPSDAMVEQARKFAEYQTFTNSLGRAGSAIQTFANAHLPLKLIFPFIRTPLNLLKYANERTPLGVFSKQVQENLATPGVRRDTQIARMALGTTVATAVTGLVLNDLVTGGGPSNPREKEAKRLVGWRPYSIRVGDFYYDYNWLDPLSTVMGVTADLTDAVRSGVAEDAEVDKIVGALIASISKNILSKASLRGASDLVQALTDPDRYGPKYLQNLAGTVVPSVIAQSAAAQDPLLRDARTVLAAIKARIHGLRETVLPKRDVWGEPIPNQGALGPDLLSPIMQGKINNDPVNRALAELKFSPAPVLHTIRDVQLTPQQYDDYARIGGRMAKIQLDALVGAFSHMPPEMRRKLIESTVSHARELAATKIMIESVGSDNDIMKKAMDAKVSALQGATHEHVKEMLKVR